MTKDIKQEVLRDLTGALRMVGQAQERLSGGAGLDAVPAEDRALWKDIGGLFDEVEGLQEAVEEGDYD